MINAFSKSSAACLWIIEIAYSMKSELQGSIIGPEFDIPNSSSANLKSSVKILLFRSSATCLWIMEIVYSMKFESQGSIIGPELAVPNSSSAILKSSLIISLLRVQFEAKACEKFILLYKSKAFSIMENSSVLLHWPISPVS